MKQFDSSIVGKPYSRVMNINIEYTSAMTAQVNVEVQPHVKLLDDTHVALGVSETLTFGISPEDIMKGSVDLRDVSTGALLGASIPLAHLFTGVASLIRAKELEQEQSQVQPDAVTA